MAYAEARLVALRGSVAGRALDFEEEPEVCRRSRHMHMLHRSCSKSSWLHFAFASARLMALRRLVAGRALDFEQELCSIKAL